MKRSINPLAHLYYKILLLDDAMDDLVIQLAKLPEDLPQIHQIRYQVFQIEQGVDPTLEFDGKDDQAAHFLVYLNQKAVATARIQFLDEHTAKIERVAVWQELRGAGIGRRLMEQTLDFLAEQQIRLVYMNAQQSVQGFYEKLGFEPEGTVFEEAGIPHIRMKQLLRLLD